MMDIHVWASPASLFIIVLAWLLLPPAFAFFYSAENKHTTNNHLAKNGVIDLKDVVLKQPQGQDNRLLPPRSMILDFTMTFTRFGWSHMHPTGQLTFTRHSDCVPQPDGSLMTATRSKNSALSEDLIGSPRDHFLLFISAHDLLFLLRQSSPFSGIFT